MRRKVYFNGKFYCGNLNGVHRVADRLIHEVDAALVARPELRDHLDVRLLVPERRAWSPALAAITLDVQKRGHTQFWEQFIAPWRARDGLLVNLCNLSPILHFRKITLMHDAQFFLFPKSYPFRFRLGYRVLTPLMARTSREVLTISQFSREMLQLFGVAPRARTRVINNGADHVLAAPCDEQAADALGLERGGYVLLFGSAMRYKNVQVVFEAFARGGLEGLKLVVVGPGRAELEKAGLTPPAACTFVGPVNDGLLRALYERALCLAYPSRTEGFGLPPLEAMLCGCPVVVAPAGAVPEVCRDSALYAEVDTPEAWTGSFQLLRQDAALRSLKVGQGRRRAAEFTWARAGAQLLEAILGHAGAAPAAGPADASAADQQVGGERQQAAAEQSYTRSDVGYAARADR